MNNTQIPDSFTAFDMIAQRLSHKKQVSEADIKTITGPLKSLSDIFDLNPFELFILTCCAGVELHTDMRTALTNNTDPFFVTIDHICSLYEAPEWDAFTPNSPLLLHGLLHRGHKDMPFPASTLRADEWVTHYVMGHHIWPNILSNVHLSDRPYGAPAYQENQAKAIAQLWQQDLLQGHGYAMALNGPQIEEVKDVAYASILEMGFIPYHISPLLLPRQGEQLQDFITAWIRHYLAYSGVLILDVSTLDRERLPEIYAAIDTMIAKEQFPFILIGADKVLRTHNGVVTQSVKVPDYQDKLTLMRSIIPENTFASWPDLEDLAWRFALNSRVIEQIKHVVEAASPDVDQATLHRKLYNLCCAEFKADFKGLADYVDTSKTWDDLIVPPDTEKELQAIITYLRHQKRIYHDWGFGQKKGTQIGVCALFSGASGTGKTTAAAILARELELELVRVNLSSVTSKYIGETEKNLATIFDAAEQSNVLLLFDEADALFGKRSEVKDSRDRYANMEVSYLLQRIENYSGLAILTTNIKESFDKAFTRRFRFMIDFPFPSQAERKIMWQSMIPDEMPVDQLQFDKLAMLNATGGMIYNIILRAAYSAAETNTPLSMDNLSHAARAEFGKDNRQTPDALLQDWVFDRTPLAFAKSRMDPPIAAQKETINGN